MSTPLTKTIPQNTSYLQNGLRVDTNNLSNTYGFGVQQPTLCMYNLVPLRSIADLIVSANAPVPGVAFPLRANAITTGLGGQGVTLDCNRAVSVYLTIPAQSVAAAVALTGAVSIICNGYDDRGVALTSTINLTTGSAFVNSSTTLTTTTAFTFPKMYSRVTSVVWNGATQVNVTGGAANPVTLSVTVGTGSSLTGMQLINASALGIGTVANGPTGIDAFGLPFFCPYRHYVISATWGSASGITNANPPALPGLFSIPIITPGSNALSTASTGGFVPGYQVNPLGATGGPALPTSSTRDARGYIFVPISGIPNGPVNLSPTSTQRYGDPAFSTSDAVYSASGFAGYNMLSVLFYAYGADSYVQAGLTNGNASAQMQTLIFGPTNPAIGYGSTTPSAQPSQLLAKDEVGLQNSTPGV